MLDKVRSRSGPPIESDFTSKDGSPLVQDTNDGLWYAYANSAVYPVSILSLAAYIGSGVSTNTALGNFFTAASGRVAFIPAGTYTLTSLLSVTLSNSVIIGVPGLTKIVGSFGYALIRLLALDNVVFFGITFQTDYVNAVEDPATSVVYSDRSNVAEAAFRQCKFSAPTSNTNGLTFYTRTSAGDTAATIDGLWIEDCDFENIGRIGCTIMNRGTAADKYTAAKRVYFNKNKGKNLGINGNYGMLVSFDGFGSAFTCDDNLVEKAFDIGIENAGWCDGSISRNRFRDFTRAYMPIGMSSTVQMHGLTVRDNRTMDPASNSMTWYNVDKSHFGGNSFEMGAAGQTAVVLMRDCNDNEFEGERYINSNATDGRYAVLLEAVTASKRNKFRGGTFDTSASVGNFSVIRFNSAGTSENQLLDVTINKGTGGSLVDEIGSAANNYADHITNAGVTVLPAGSQNFASDADMTVTLFAYSCESLTITDTGVVLTAARNVVLPRFAKKWVVFNSTAQTLTFKTAAGTGIAVATGKTAVVYGNETNILRATADV